MTDQLLIRGEVVRGPHGPLLEVYDHVKVRREWYFIHDSDKPLAEHLVGCPGVAARLNGLPLGDGVVLWDLWCRIVAVRPSGCTEYLPVAEWRTAMGDILED